MFVSNNNYNVLGKIGPHYDRPEYRPPSQTDIENQKPGAQSSRSDRSTLSTKNTDVAPKKAVSVPTGKINLEQAQEMVAASSQMIRGLSPLSTTQEPHFRLPSRLMPSVYV